MCVIKREHAITCLCDQERQGLQQALIERVDCVSSLRGNRERADLASDYHVKCVSLWRNICSEICRINSKRESVSPKI